MMVLLSSALFLVGNLVGAGIFFWGVTIGYRWAKEAREPRDALHRAMADAGYEKD